MCFIELFSPSCGGVSSHFKCVFLLYQSKKTKADQSSYLYASFSLYSLRDIFYYDLIILFICNDSIELCYSIQMLALVTFKSFKLVLLINLIRVFKTRLDHLLAQDLLGLKYM